MGKPILEVKNLRTCFDSKKKTTYIVDGVNFTVQPGETLCIVGESGCGKSMTSLAIMGLLPENGRIAEGEIRFKGENLVHKSKKEMSKIRGNDISMIFQEPMTSLNPVQTVGRQISETIRIHQKLGKKEAQEKAIEMLRLVGIPSPEKRVDAYPHEMSGGMRQRVMIAMALSCNPDLLIADEPTTALDVTIQAQILNLMNQLKKELGMSIILITHDLGVVAEMADKVLVMYAGKVVEYTDVKTLFNDPSHPYTRGLLDCIPKLDEDPQEESLLPVIRGTVPSPGEMPAGCRFYDRCDEARPVCRQVDPPLTEKSPGHRVSCLQYDDAWDGQQAERGKEVELHGDRNPA